MSFTKNQKDIALAIHCDADAALTYLTNIRADFEAGTITHEVVSHLVGYLFRHIGDFVKTSVGPK